MAQDHSDNQSSLFQAVVGHLGLLFRLERRILGLIVSYLIAIGLFSLIVPSLEGASFAGAELRDVDLRGPAPASAVMGANVSGARRD